MLPEVKEIESTLKQILYGCVEHVQATKAALYLSASNDLNEKTYELVTSYQYNAANREVVTAKDDLVDRLTVKRSAFYINGYGSDRDLAEMLFRQGTDRLLIAPLFSRGRLVGFIDMRDKAARKPFENSDLEAAGVIADEVMRVLAAKQLYGVAPISLVDVPIDTARGGAQRAAPVPSRGASDVAREVPSPQAKQAIEAAREYLSRRQLSRATGRRTAGEHEIDLLKLLLPGALSLPGAVFAALSGTGKGLNPRHIVSRATLTEDVLTTLQHHIEGILGQADIPAIDPESIRYPTGVQSIPATSQLITAIISAPVNGETLDGVMMTVGFEHFDEADAQRALRHFLRQVEQPVEEVIARSYGIADRQRIAEKLLEPDFERYPALVEHSRRVSVLAHRFALVLEMPPTLAETIRIAALVHDVGFRLIDYDALYSEPGITPEQKRIMREHPILGAALVEPLLGSDVAQAVLRHHERVDGTGYPSRLSGDRIPRSARIIQIADAWVAMTTQQPYQMALPYEIAVARMREVAGTQLDAGLVDVFLDALPQMIA